MCETVRAHLMPSRPSLLFRQFCSFLGVGGIATVLQYIILIILVEIVGVRPGLASGVGYAAGAGVSYFLNYRYTFVSHRRHALAMGKFFFVAAMGLAVNSAIVVVATESLGLNYMLAQVIATGLVLLWNFSANRWWTFRPTP